MKHKKMQAKSTFQAVPRSHVLPRAKSTKNSCKYKMRCPRAITFASEQANPNLGGGIRACISGKILIPTKKTNVIVKVTVVINSIN